jgi:hypothetical protein
MTGAARKDAPGATVALAVAAGRAVDVGAAAVLPHEAMTVAASKQAMSRPNIGIPAPRTNPT